MWDLPRDIPLHHLLPAPVFRVRPTLPLAPGSFHTHQGPRGVPQNLQIAQVGFTLLLLPGL